LTLLGSLATDPVDRSVIHARREEGNQSLCFSHLWWTFQPFAQQADDDVLGCPLVADVPPGESDHSRAVALIQHRDRRRLSAAQRHQELLVVVR
jgi:hypothetical protein